MPCVGGVVGDGVAWASACESVSTEDEATSPNTAAHPRKASALRRQTSFGSERLLIFRLPACCPVRACHQTWEPSYWSGSTWRPAPSHAGISADGIAILGRCGTMVPAVTISPSSNLVRAKSLASTSVANVLVKRGCRRLDSVPSVGTSKVTYQVWFMPFRHQKKSRLYEVVTASFSLLTCKQVLYRRTAARATGRAPSTTPALATQWAG